MLLEKNKLRQKLNEEGGNVWIAVSIIIAGALVAAAVIFTGNDKGANDITLVQEEIINEPEVEIVKIPEVTTEDYILGSIDAPIKIVEYSDMECPYCKLLQDTLHEVVKEYPNDVAWVYRHLPIVNSHPKALDQAVAVECAGLQGGNDAFWKLLDRIYEVTPGNNRFDMTNIEKFAKEQGLVMEEFNQCLSSGQFNEKITKQINDGFAAGSQGTPFSVIIGPSGEHIPVSGAQPISVWMQIIKDVLEE